MALTRKQHRLAKATAVVLVAGAAGAAGAGGAVAAALAEATGEALTRVLDWLADQIDARPDTKRLLEGLSGDLMTWANGENVSTQKADVTAGLELALSCVSKAGITIDDLVREEFDHGKIAARALARAHAADPEWAVSQESRYVIANRAVAIAYTRLASLVADREPGLRPAFRELAARLTGLELRVSDLEKEHDERIPTVTWSDFAEATKAARADFVPGVLPGVDRMKWIHAGAHTPGRLPTPMAIIGDGGLGKSVTAGQLYDELTSAGEEVLIVQCSAVPRAAQLHRPADVDLALSEAAAGRMGVPPLTKALSELAPDHDPLLIIDTLDLLLNDSSALAITSVIQDLAEHHRLVVLCREREWKDFEVSSGLTNVSELLLPRLAPAEIVEWAHEFVVSAGKSVHAGFEASLRRAAQTVGASDVLGVPLRLAMACELYADSEEIPDDLSVVSLYRTYWARRVARDREGLRGETAREQERAALLVAEAIWNASRERFVEWIAPPTTAAPDAMGRLRGEGVLRESGHRTRFFHQTFAEFAVAQHLQGHAGPEELDVLGTRLAENDSGTWGVASYLLTPELDSDTYAALADAIPADSGQGMRILLRGALERSDDAESMALVAHLAQQAPDWLALYPELFLTVDEARRKASAETLLSLVVGQESRLNRLADAAAKLCSGLDADTRARYLTPALQTLSAREPTTEKLNPVFVRLMAGYPDPLGAGDATELIDLYPHLPAPARARVITHVVASLIELPNTLLTSLITHMLRYELPSGSIDDAVELLIYAWSDSAQRDALGWHTWRDLLDSGYPTRWDAAQTRAVAKAAGADESIFHEMMDEALHPSGVQSRSRLNNAAEFLATWWPDLVSTAVMEVGIAADRMAVSTASAMLRRVATAVPGSRNELARTLQEVADVDPQEAWPTILRLVHSDAATFAWAEASLLKFLTGEGVDPTAVKRTRRNCFQALLQDLTPAQLEDHGDLLRKLTSGQEGTDRVNSAVLLAARAPVSAAARREVTPLIVMGPQTTAAIAAAKTLRDGLTNWVPQALDTTGVQWFLELLDTPFPKAAEHIADALYGRLNTVRWAAGHVTRVVDRLTVSLARGEDVQVSDKLRTLLTGVARVAPFEEAPLSFAQLDSILTAYRQALQAALRDRRPGDQRAAGLWAGYNSTVSALALNVMSQDQVEDVVKEILQVDSAPISNRANRTTAVTIVGFLERYPLRFPLVEELWSTLPEPAMAAVAECLDRGAIPGKEQAASRLVDLGGPASVTARLLTIIETGGSRRMPTPGRAEVPVRT